MLMKVEKYILIIFIQIRKKKIKMNKSFNQKIISKKNQYLKKIKNFFCQSNKILNSKNKINKNGIYEIFIKINSFLNNLFHKKIISPLNIL